MSISLQYALPDLHSLSLSERKGYLTISLNHTKGGTLLLRSCQGIAEWYDCLKSAMADSVWPASSGVDHWLLSRRNIAGKQELVPRRED